ncbi:MAG: hypothetical protein ACREQ5_26195 [Candidatus Dormibacteria bacterium]
MSERTDLLQRLDAAEARLAARSTTSIAESARTAADAKSGEQWEAGQVWAHLAEFIPFWIDQTQLVIDRYTDEPVAFGRVSTDPGRLGAIERDRTQPISVLWIATHSDLETLRLFIEELDERSWSARGLHPTRGVMDVQRILDEFLVGHLEEHAEQLDSLAHAGAG